MRFSFHPGFIATFFIFLFSHAMHGNAAETKTEVEFQGDLPSFPLLLQNMAPFQTIECVFVVEYVKDGKEIEEKSRKKVAWDFKKNRVKIIEMKANYKEKTMECIQENYLDGKVIRAKIDTDYDENFSFSTRPQKGNRSSALILSKSPDMLELLSRCDYISYFYCDIEGKYTLIFDGIKQLLKRKDKKKITDSELVLDSNVLTIDKKNGTIPSKIYKFRWADGEVIDYKTWRVESFVLQNGRFFPHVFTVQVHKSVSVPGLIKRVTLEPNSLKIDADLSLADFAINLPQNTTVVDRIKGKKFNLDAIPMTTLESDQTENLLKELIEKAKK
jgi:hypothetical protein